MGRHNPPAMVLTRSTTVAARRERRVVRLRVERERVKKVKAKKAKAPVKPKAKKAKAPVKPKALKTECCACDKTVLSWHKSLTWGGIVTTINKGRLTCHHKPGYSSYDSTNVALCTKCVIKFYREDFVAGKILKCFAPECSRVVDPRYMFSYADRAKRRKKATALKRKNVLPAHMKALRKSHEVQQCPGCGLVCQRTFGCDHISCPQCGCDFDYMSGELHP